MIKMTIRYETAANKKEHKTVVSFAKKKDECVKFIKTNNPLKATKNKIHNIHEIVEDTGKCHAKKVLNKMAKNS